LASGDAHHQKCVRAIVARDFANSKTRADRACGAGALGADALAAELRGVLGLPNDEDEREENAA